MDIDIDIDQVARLASLALTPEEAGRLGPQLGAILDYVAELSTLDTDDVPPTTHALPLETAFREDAVTEHLDRATVLAAAPVHDDEAFIVPKVV